ncbi:Mediator of RNA polymerase II transcription subunit 17 [Desmophyllum pertusum]|uniref:Mediator of RNA polymerase II transcription subunit 17 n=1 Tax=Desmophyllum pertusum TaxID=174260 RepID=A0A9X0CMA0_9CNID|nr:Mediator of RNA polymerase II transcription subunit 17 [Desmophyllum pertusum]
MASRLAVDIAIESLLENEVEEISRDGQEKYVPQLSMSEKLAKLAHKIDFLSDVKGHGEDADKEDEEKSLVTFQPSLWPWDSVRENLRKSLTEVCVLSDVLNVMHDKKYMVLDPVSQNQATPKPTLSLITKKKSLTNAADILLRGAQRMEDAVKERADQNTRQGSSVKDFHSELMMLRKRWRLKRTGTAIMGDLTYRSAGSQFRNPGLFEVTKATRDEERAAEQSTSDNRALEVTVGSDLEGTAEIRVAIVQSGEDLEIATVRGLMSGCYDNMPTVIPSWQQKLESAQSNLFCKELFVQLSQGAYNTKENRPHFVMANEIRAEIFPGTDLCITYSCRKNNSEESSSKMTHRDKAPRAHSLEYALHSLLRKQHYQAQTLLTPHPVTAYPTQGGNKRLCLAGPSAMTAAEVAPYLQSDGLLETVLNISRHKVLQRRAVEVVDTLKARLTDPCITCHWSSIGCDTTTLATVHITSPEVGHLARSSFQLHVGVRGIHVVNADGDTVDISTHAQDLEDFILSQVCNHRLSVAHSLAQSLGWHVIHCSRHVGTGPKERQGHVGGLMVKSPNGSKAVAVRTGPTSGVSILVRRPQVPCGVAPELLGSMNWGSLGGDFIEVHWSKMPGRTFVQKLFLLLAIEMY